MTDNVPPHTTRLYASLSEPRPIMGMDYRLVWTAGVLMVAAVVSIPFSGWLCYAPSLACLLGCVGVARFAKKLWTHNPWFLDEYWAHIRTPLSGGADENPAAR